MIKFSKIIFNLFLTILLVYLLFIYKYHYFPGIEFWFLLDEISYRLYFILIIFVSYIFINILYKYKKNNIFFIFIFIVLIYKNIFYEFYNGFINYIYLSKDISKNIDTEKIKQISYFNYKNIQMIAHAGGEIDKNIYTNSLEALNHSYNKGVKYFELDIRKTQDNKYVAVHSWEQWKDFTGYQGKIPTLKTFLKYKILDKQYTPMDIHLINKWFKNHKDAYLVTDKVDIPSEFIKKFKFKNRLIMELLSIKSILESTNLKIHASPSTNIIKLLGNKGPNILYNMGIKYISVSYNFRNTDLLKDYMKYGIKVFIYGNYGKEIKSKYFYGRYVNNIELYRNHYNKDNY